MKSLLLLIVLFCAMLSNAQTPDTTKPFVTFVGPECMPEYKGGTDAMLRFIGKNLKVPDVDDYNILGTVYVQFTVDTLGKVQDAKAVREISNCKYCTTEAVRVVNLLEFVPCRYNGKVVATQLVMPIKFTLR